MVIHKSELLPVIFDGMRPVSQSIMDAAQAAVSALQVHFGQLLDLQVRSYQGFLMLFYVVLFFSMCHSCLLCGVGKVVRTQLHDPVLAELPEQTDHWSCGHRNVLILNYLLGQLHLQEKGSSCFCFSTIITNV